MTASTEYPPILQKDFRELVRRRGDPIPQTVSLQQRDGTVRMTMMAPARDDLDEVPDSITQWYLPNQRAIVTLLPENDSDDSDVSLFDFVE